MQSQVIVFTSVLLIIPSIGMNLDWANDIHLMKEAGFTVARMGEFAWSTMEPSQGEYIFDWLEYAIAKLADVGIASVLGTPTAAPPAWLVQKHPDLMAVDEHGHRVQFGNRCHYCVNSPEFHEATGHIVAEMGQRFGANPNVIGWQLDNEYNRVCYCERCQKLFQQFLKNKYDTLDALNDHWSTAYWSQTYSAWEQIPIPIGAHNPALMLEFKRFVTDSYRKFQKMQIDILRQHVPAKVWITHNFMGWFDGLDHYSMSEDLDMVSWDWYVGTGHHNHLVSGAIHDLTRGFKRKNFWLIETQPGNVNWSSINNVVNKGEARVMAWHAVAHGADAVLYWQWRSALGGQEQYHGTLVDQSGQPRPFYEEAKQLAEDFAKTSNVLAGTTPVSDVALLNSYDNRWSIHAQRHHKDFDYVAHFNHYYRALAVRNIATDVLSVDASLDEYKLVIAPALLMLNDKRAAQLKTFVENGGHLVLTIRSGMKDEFNALLPLRQPGMLAEISGVEVEEYYALLDPSPVTGDEFKGESRIWAERVKLKDDDTQVIARYGKSNGWLDGQAAITSHAFGKGCVTYVGAWLDDISQQKLIDDIVRSAGVEPVMKCPVGVEARRRVNEQGQEVFIVINHERTEKRIKLPWLAHEHLTRLDISELKLEPYEVAVLTRLEKDSSS
ncbi:MAG: beta-galactosidase [Anaerolineales bacterium]